MKITPERAIRNLQLGIENTLFDGFFTAALIMGSDALQRNIPKEVNYIFNGFYMGQNKLYDKALCPKCDQIFEQDDEIWESKFCPNCGQALKWECAENKEEEKHENTDGDS